MSLSVVTGLDRLGPGRGQGHLIAAPSELVSDFPQGYLTHGHRNSYRPEPRVGDRPCSWRRRAGSECGIIAQLDLSRGLVNDRLRRACVGPRRFGLSSQPRHVQRLQLPSDCDCAGRHEDRQPCARAHEARSATTRRAPGVGGALPAMFPGITRMLAIPVAIFKTHVRVVAPRRSVRHRPKEWFSVMSAADGLSGKAHERPGGLSAARQGTVRTRVGRDRRAGAGFAEIR